jgi:hypothetical protein
MQLNNVEVSELSDQQIEAEMREIGSRWKKLWTEQSRRKNQGIAKASAAVDEIIRGFQVRRIPVPTGFVRRI